MKRTITIVLLLMLILPLICQDKLMEMKIVGKAKKTSEIIPASIKDVNNRKAACIIFLTDLEVEMEFKPNVELVKYIAKPGRHEVYVQPNERMIEVYALGYKPLDVVLYSYGIPYLDEGDVYHLELTGDKKKDFSLVVISNPADAEKWLDGELLGTGESFNITKGEHTLEVKKKGYTTIRKNFTANDQITTFRDMKMLPALEIPVDIDSEPQGAIVYIDNVRFGVTPVVNFFDEGTFPIRIEMENYETIEEQLIIKEPETKKQYKLNDIRCKLTIRTSPNAVVYFDNKNYPGGFENLTLLPQTINFRIEEKYCKTISESYELKNGEAKIFELYPEDISAYITIISTEDATIKFNGETFRGKVENYRIEPQVLSIVVEKPKSKPVERSIAIKPNAIEVIEIKLETERGTIRVTTIPTDGFIELLSDTGEKYSSIGRNDFTNLPIGNYLLSVSAEGYNDYRENIKLNIDEVLVKKVKLDMIPGYEKKNNVKTDLSKKPKSEKGHLARNWYWYAGGVAVGAATSYFLFSGKEEVKSNTTTVNITIPIP
ncbi:MAG: PEGA domain-containing protein [Candidatus Cloacimonetes bacterium]|nr:PEGA domain-containing protein [Candidatus Cloacimonadota bacterium]